MNRFRSVSLIASLVLNIVLGVVVWGGVRDRLALTLSADFHVLRTSSRLEHYRRVRIAMLDSRPRRTGAIVFLGDSLTEAGHWREWLDDDHVQNFGVSGDTTADLLGRLGQVISRRPAAIVLCIGVNDIGNIGLDKSTENFARILDQLASSVDARRIFVLGVPPMSDPFKSAEGAKLDSAEKQIALSRKCVVLDLRSRLSKHGATMGEEFTVDGTHLNAEGYEQWLELIRPAMASVQARGDSEASSESSVGTVPDQ